MENQLLHDQVYERLMNYYEYKYPDSELSDEIRNINFTNHLSRINKSIDEFCNFITRDMQDKIEYYLTIGIDIVEICKETAILCILEDETIGYLMDKIMFEINHQLADAIIKSKKVSI